MAQVTARSLRAFNRAVDSENRVHDPEFARTLGFRGGLVPGVDVFAYMASLVADRWGEEWVAAGALDARFSSPVYDGDRLDVRGVDDGPGRLLLTVTDAAGIVCASGVARDRQADGVPDPDVWRADPAPRPKLVATPAALGAVQRLGGITEVVSAAAAEAQLAEVLDAVGLFRERRIVHPGHLLRYADRVLMESVALPPWMHVSSNATFFGPLRWDERLTVMANRGELFERKGHRFVQLDVLMVGPRGPVMRVHPYTAIYDPAWNRTGL